MTERPESLSGETKQTKAACGTIYVTINALNDVPIECFIKIGKGGGCACAQCEAMARLVAWGLRSKGALSEVAEQLRGISCPEAQIDGSKISCAHAVSVCIERYLKNKETTA